ncbi:acyl-CoA dehydrogenase family protein [Planktothrix sp. FACHB-1355]|uniref:Acyl-CoA dehydrogenase family protein n=1 Tax=Aerosakkonema funiforme FACHB-1375 TaxID=2949571 RepID=A0A926VGW5_9CYAN|nr:MULTISPECIES: acyl-CoA dehydrogenase family protein [Oscillatoriales]MBD2183508.1 acyl-CoA dehydrogenase family protein [Aerosakkonema funiforme FACHB-1375]MBD3557945.1 acyl-CoA dehydrogenase family protein [Planktothrix sp. FACHB-1355]
MKLELTVQQKEDRSQFRAFVDAEIVPLANQCDREEHTPIQLIENLAKKGYLGAIIPKDFGGSGMDAIAYGLLNEEIGRGCSSLRSLLTVHNMVSHAILKWGNKQQKEYWLPKLATGEVIAAFALSEANVGSDAKSIETTATLDGDTYLLNGQKKWITYGQIADIFLVFAQCDGKPSAFLVEKNSPGLAIKPIFGMMGVKASMLAELHLDNCQIPAENIVGKPGFGFSYIAASALDYGRYSVAWGCVGIAQACLEASLQYTSQRKQFGVYLKEHQLIRQMITEMTANLKAARLLCYQAGYLKDTRDPKAILETSIAKYFASTIATKAANDAVQIHGANGCSSDYPVQRYLRDAKIMEIIEGSTQIQQITIADHAYQEYLIPSETLCVTSR